MLSMTLIRWGGLAAMLGGLLWIAHAIVVASMPEGCIGLECDMPDRSIRDSSVAAPLFLSALLLIALGVGGLVARAQDSARFGTLGCIGLVAAVVGVGLVVTGGLVQALFFAGDFPYMPLVVIPGGLAVIIGFLLLGIAFLKVGVLPRWAGAPLILGTLALVGFNDQNAQALMAIPFGIAWVAAGYALMFGKGEQPVSV